MKVVVTGSSGFIGSRLVKKLRQLEHEVIEVDTRQGIDILNFEQMLSIDKFDALVHLAAMSFVPLSFEKPRDFYHLNVNGVINGLELCRLHNARFIFSSSYVYGKPKYLPIDENHPLDGFNPYAETKIIGEEICENYFKHFNVSSIILRPFNIYGPNQNESFLIPSILKQAKTGKIKLLDPYPKRDFIYVDDVVNAFKLAIESTKIEFNQFNIGFGTSYSVNDVVEIVNQLYNGTLTIEYSNEKRKNEVTETVADIIKTKKALKWSPKISLLEGIKRMIK